jgi:PAS domain S-box-containing protein
VPKQIPTKQADTRQSHLVHLDTAPQLATNNWEAVADDLPLAIIATSRDGTVTTWSPAASRLYGWSEAEALGSPIQLLTVGPTEAEVAEAIMATVLCGEPWEGEFTACRRDGSTIEVHVINLPILLGDGQIDGIIGLSFDVSTARADLKSEVERLTEIAASTARTRLEERRRIARDLHDDLGQLLASLRTEILRSGEGSCPVNFDRLLTITNSCISEVRRISGDLQRTPLTLPALIEQVHTAAGGLTERTGIQVDLHINPDLTPQLLAQPLRPTVLDELEHIIGEALTNIERHSSASTVQIQIDITAETLCVEIHDDGRGIPQITNSSGCGLQTMSQRVERINGHISVVNTDPGTLVKCQIPLSPPHAGRS